MLERIETLEFNIGELQRLKKKYTLADIASDKHIEWSLRYGLFESIQIIIDLSCHIVNKYNLGQPKTYENASVFLKIFNTSMNH